MISKNKFQDEKGKQLVLETIKEFGGNISATANKLNCNRNTIYAVIRKYPELNTVLDDVRAKKYEDLKEHVYGRAYKNDMLAKWWISTQAHKYGDNFSEKAIIENRNVDFSNLSDKQLKEIIETGTFSE